MIVLLKNMDDIVDARAYLLHDENSTLDAECADYKKEKKNPESFPPTVIKDKKKTLMTVGFKNSDLLLETYGFESRFVSHYGDVAIWFSDRELKMFSKTSVFFVWTKDDAGKITAYVFHPFDFIGSTRLNNSFANYVKQGASIFSISLVKNGKNLLGEDYLKIYELN